jgi:hypothetical protein
MKLPSSGWWPVQICYQLGCPLPSAYTTMSPSSGVSATETPPSYLAQLEWLDDEIMLYNFQDGTFSSISKEQRDFYLAPFKERSKHVKFTQGKVNNRCFIVSNNQLLYKLVVLCMYFTNATYT